MAIRIQQGNTHTISHIQHMYSKMHAAIDMHHMNGNMDMIITPPAKQYHTPAIHYKTSLYQNSTIHSICTQHYIYGNILLACNITNIQPIHMQPHICNETHVILISSNAQIQQHMHYKCV